jgi:hypothetical protein
MRSKIPRIDVRRAFADYDSLYKSLITAFFVEFVDFAVPEFAGRIDPDSVVFLDKELLKDVFGSGKRIADIVVRCRLLPIDENDRAADRAGERIFLIHVEHQSQREADFPLRMCEYCVRFARTYRCDVYPIALLSYDQPRNAEPDTFAITFPHRTVLQFRFHAVQLNRLNWRDYLKRPGPVSAALMTKMNVAAEDRRRVTLECLRMVATLRLDRTRLRFLSEFIGVNAQLTGSDLEGLHQDVASLPRAERDKIMPLTNSWVEYGRAEGLAKGIEQGIEHGRIDGARDMLCRLAERRLGSPPADVLAAVHAIGDLSRLNDLALHVSDVESWQDLLAYDTAN